jgi:hypothetical protein
VHDRFERTPRVGVGEDRVGERPAVERPVLRDDVWPEPVADPHQPGGTWFERPPGQVVGVDHDGATAAEHARDGRFPRPDPTRERDEQHCSDATADATVSPGRGLRHAARASVGATLASPEILEDRLE